MFVVKKCVQLIIEIVDFSTSICHKSTTYTCHVFKNCMYIIKSIYEFDAFLYFFP